MATSSAGGEPARFAPHTLLTILSLLVIASVCFADLAAARTPLADSPPARAAEESFLPSEDDITWIRVHPSDMSPCAPADTVGSPAAQSPEHVWCFEGDGGDDSWPAGPGGDAHFDHYSAFDPPEGLTSRWHVTPEFGGPTTGMFNAWCGCDAAGANEGCSDLPFWQNDNGYGNDWREALELDLTAFDASAGGTIEFDLRYDAECDWDYITLEYYRPAYNRWDPVTDGNGEPAIFNGVSGHLDDDHGGYGDGCGDDYFGHGNQTASGEAYGQSVWLEDVAFPLPVRGSGGIRIRWRCQTDGGWSDEDGEIDTDGMAALDNVTVTLAATGTVVSDDFETGGFDGIEISGPAPALGTAAWVRDPVAGNRYDSWRLAYAPDYLTEGEHCSFADDWMWTARPDGPFPPEADGFDMMLVTPKVDVSGWTGALVEASEYYQLPEEREDTLRRRARVHVEGMGWSAWDSLYEWWIGYGGYWSMNARYDISSYLGEDVDSLQFAWSLIDYSQPGDYSWGRHGGVEFLVDNVSIGLYDADRLDLLPENERLPFVDTFSRSDPAHSAHLENDEQGQWPARAFDDDEFLTVEIHYQAQVPDGNVKLHWRVGVGAPPSFGAWAMKAMQRDPSYHTRFRSALGNDADEDWSGAAGDGLIWEAGTTVEYYVTAVDDAGNEGRLPREGVHEFNVLPFDNTSPQQGGAKYLLVTESKTQELDFEASSGFDADRGDGVGGFELPAYADPGDLAATALDQLGITYDRYRSYSSSSEDYYNHPRGLANPQNGLGGYLDANGQPYYDAMLWIYGSQTYSALTASDRADLATYLDAGGRVFFGGSGFVAWGIGDPTLGGDPVFATEYLGLDTTSHDDFMSAPTLDGIGTAGTAWENDRYTIFLGCHTRHTLDRLTPGTPTGAIATVLLEYTGGEPIDEGRAAIVRNERTVGGGVSVLSGFDLSAMISHDAMACVLMHSIGDEFGLTVPNVSDCSDVNTIPVLPQGGAFALSLPQPSPFRVATQFAFRLDRAGVARVTVHDVGGRLVTTLTSGYRGLGPHVLTWDGRTRDGDFTPAGVYFVRLESGEQRAVRKVVRMP